MVGARTVQGDRECALIAKHLILSPAGQATQVDDATMRTHALLRTSVTGLNLRRPTFSEHNVRVMVREGQPAGFFLAVLSATDRDPVGTWVDTTVDFAIGRHCDVSVISC